MGDFFHPTFFLLMRAAHFLPFAFALFGASSAAVTTVTDNADVTVTLTSDYTQVVTLSEFIYTNSDGSLTSQFYTPNVTPTGSATATVTDSTSASPTPSSALSLPTGTYYTSTSQVTTTLEDGSSAVIEYILYLTNTCGV